MSYESSINDEVCTKALEINAVSKVYKTYERPEHRLYEPIANRFGKVFGRPPRTFGHVFKALDGISFDVEKGETVGIIGYNGSGKSTLLQLICGTSTPSSGQIKTNGKIAALLELGSGFNPEFTGRENVFLNASIYGMSREEIDDKYNDIVTFAGIEDFMSQPVKTYSSGMAVRLAFSVIAHVDADILVIDEALAVGDAIFTQKCMRFIESFQSQGTLLFVSHDTSAVQ
ncbi:MAG: lipopolysaccharide transport system ATP-binding protein, partial [Candidatus Azotimanducaceae bacterium]